MPKTKGPKIERVPVRLPKPLMDMIDKIVKRTPVIAPNRQQFVEQAVREKIQTVLLMERELKPT